MTEPDNLGPNRPQPVATDRPAVAAGPKRVAVPAHLWVVAGAGLLVNLAWLTHALLSLNGNSAFFKLLGYGRDQIDYYTGYPWLPAIFWALAIGAGFAGCIALLRRRASAVGLLAGSVFSQLVLLGLSLTLLDSANVLGPFATGSAIVAVVIGTGLAGYAWWAGRRGVLR